MRDMRGSVDDGELSHHGLSVAIGYKFSARPLSINVKTDLKTDLKAIEMDTTRIQIDQRGDHGGVEALARRARATGVSTNQTPAFGPEQAKANVGRIVVSEQRKVDVEVVRHVAGVLFGERQSNVLRAERQCEVIEFETRGLVTHSAMQRRVREGCVSGVNESENVARCGHSWISIHRVTRINHGCGSWTACRSV